MPEFQPDEAIAAWASVIHLDPLLRESRRMMRVELLETDRTPVNLRDKAFTVGQHVLRRWSAEGWRDPLLALLFHGLDHFAFDDHDTSGDVEPFQRQWQATHDPQQLLVLADWLEDRGDPWADELRYLVPANPCVVLTQCRCQQREDGCLFCQGVGWVSTPHPLDLPTVSSPA